MASPSQPPDPLEGLRRRGRRAGLVVFGVLVASVTAWWSIQIMIQVWAPAVLPLNKPCRVALADLLQGLGLARQAAAAETGGEKAGLQAFRQALEPSWSTRPGLEQVCAGDAEALAALPEIDELRYAEEHAVRYEAVRLARQRKRANAIAELLGAQTLTSASLPEGQRPQTRQSTGPLEERRPQPPPSASPPPERRPQSPPLD